MNHSVVREWLSMCTLKQQTVVLCAIRGCDGVRRDHPSKACVKYLRASVLENAATATSEFMNGGSMNFSFDAITAFVKNMDECSTHFVLHFIHAAEIIGYYHPDVKIAKFWMNAYKLFVDAMHVNMESKEECEYRLRDGVDSD